jgi:hypothetical protein
MRSGPGDNNINSSVLVYTVNLKPYVQDQKIIISPVRKLYKYLFLASVTHNFMFICIFNAVKRGFSFLCLDR